MIINGLSYWVDGGIVFGDGNGMGKSCIGFGGDYLIQVIKLKYLV